MKTCSIAGCDGKVHARGLCSKHYNRWKRHGGANYVKPKAVGCSVAGCGREHFAKGYCRKHHKRWWKHGDANYVKPPAAPCLVAGCDVRPHAKGYCRKHHERWRKHGDALHVDKTVRRRTDSEYKSEMEKKHPTIKVCGGYKNAKTPVPLGCTVCGWLWPAKPHNSLTCGSGCPQCAGTVLKTHAGFVAAMAAKHPTIKVKGEYVNATTHVALECMACGWLWGSTPSNSLIGGRGCPSCNPGGAKLAKPGRLYYLRVTTPTGSLYKIGITNHTIAKRYKGRDLENIDIIDEITYEKCADAYNDEQLILRHFSTMRRDFDRDNPVLAKGGDTELLLDNVLGVGDLQRILDACREYDSALQLAS